MGDSWWSAHLLSVLLTESTSGDWGVGSAPRRGVHSSTGGSTCALKSDRSDYKPSSITYQLVMLGKSLSPGSLTWDNDLTLWSCCVD